MQGVIQFSGTCVLALKACARFVAGVSTGGTGSAAVPACAARILDPPRVQRGVG